MNVGNTPDVVERIREFNKGRDPERLARKYRAIADNRFSFLRGTCHLFYEDFPSTDFLSGTPAGWLCGDLHLENFGTYKGENRLTYFDLNDFDEGILAPAHWDLSRFLVSTLVAAQAIHLTPAQAVTLCQHFLEVYASNLANGTARWIERTTATGMVRNLLSELRKRPRTALLDARTELKGGKRRLRIDGKKALPVEAESRKKIGEFMEEFANTQHNPTFFKVLDIARRIAGTGSLGLERYVILVRGRGGPDGNFLLDLKYQLPSSLAPFVHIKQPLWTCEAQRVASIQRRAQAIPPAFLSAVQIADRSYVLRELLPSQDRVALDQWGGKIRRLEGVIHTMAEVVAWAHIRSGGRQGSASIEEWIAFGNKRTDWAPAVLDYARSYAQQVTKDWQTFSLDLNARK